MPRMPIVQQAQPLPRTEKKIDPIACAALVITATAIALIAHPLIAVGFLALEGSALYKGNRLITLGVIAATTLLIVTLSLDILFPPAVLITFPLTIAAATFSTIVTIHDWSQRLL
jgi:hypothetical protein